MNIKHLFKLLIVVLLSTGLAMSMACGDDEGTQNGDENDLNVSENNDTENNDTENNDTENNDTENNDTENNDTENNDDPNGNINNDTQNNIDPNNDTPNNDTEVELADEAPSCEDDDPPARCDMDDFDDWGPATHIDMLAIADDECCVDFNEDGEMDNALYDLLNLDALDLDIDETNAGIQDSIDDGDIAIVFEHDGLAEIAAGQEYTINFLLADEIDETDGATISPASFESGTHPHALIPDAVTAGDLDLMAGPGTVILNLDLAALLGDADMDAELNLRISNATLDADMDAGSSSIDGGVVLHNGTLGGLLMLDDLVNALNEFASTCECLENPDSIASFDAGMIECQTDNFPAEPDCASTGEDMCGSLAEFCPGLFLAGGAADIDVTGDGSPDAFSVGLELAGSATTIVGIGDGM